MTTEYTLKYDWNEIRNFTERYIPTLEGVKIEIISLKKAEINSKNIEISGTKIKFDNNLLKTKRIGNILYFEKVNNLGADGFVKSIDVENEVITFDFFDSRSPIYPVKVVTKGIHTMPTFGYSFEDLFTLLENSNVILRISIYAFLVIDKDSFYRLLNLKSMTLDEFIEYFRDAFNKKLTNSD